MLKIANIEMREGQKTYNIKNEISDVEYNDLMQMFDYQKNLGTLRASYHILLRNGQEFLYNTSNETLKKRCIAQREDAEEVVLDVNRLISNFCASFETFIDYASIAVGRKGKENRDEFEKYKSHLFDTEFEYRFITKLRNYCIHYSYPYHELHAALPDQVELICDKDHLLQYDGWGTVKKDFPSLPNNIDIRKYIESAMVILTHLQSMVLYYYAEDIFNANVKLAEIMKKYDVKIPIIVYMKDQEIKEMYPIPLSNLIMDMKDLEICPKVKVNYVGNLSEARIRKKDG